MSAEGTDFQSLDGNLQIIDRAGGRGKMPDIIDRYVEENKFRDVLLDEFEIGIAPQVGDVIDRSSDEIVDRNDLVTARDQQITKMGA